MTIGIDLRSLQDPVGGGVAEYTQHLVKELLRVDEKNQYVLFTSGFHPHPKPSPLEGEGRVRGYHIPYPNKLLNLGLWALGWPYLDRILAKRTGMRIDLMLFPNINFIHVASDCPYILVMHDCSFTLFPKFFSLKRRLWHKAVQPQRVVQQATKIIAVSEHTKNDVVNLYGVPEEKIVVVYPGVSLTRSDLDTRSDLVRHSHLTPYFLYLGTLEPRKNVEGLIQAFEMLDQKLNIDLVIAGRPGWLYESIYRAVCQSPVRDRIHVLGPVSEEEKASLYAGAICFVYPSFYEGFGFPPLEAASYGVPVITSASSSLPEVIGDAALLVDPTNVAHIAYAMKRVASDEILRVDLQKKSKQAAARFSWQRCAQEVLDLCRNTITR